MRNFLKDNHILLRILLWSIIIVVAIHFSGNLKAKINEVVSKNNCENIPELPNKAIKLVTKIIDGDTFLIEGGYSVRILGIDTDEKDYPCYDDAKHYLEEMILNKRVKLIKGANDFDQYCRYLRYVFVNGKNVSVELVKNGLAVARFSPEDTEYRKEITQAEKEARENKVDCKWSSFDKATVNNDERKIEYKWEKLTPEITGLEVTSACQAKNYCEREMIVEGFVANVYRSRKNNIFLHFEKPYPNQCFSAVIFSYYLHKFIQTPEIDYEGKIVRVRGKIQEYKGKPEIILKEPSQIEVRKNK